MNFHKKVLDSCINSIINDFEFFGKAGGYLSPESLRKAVIMTIDLRTVIKLDVF